MCTIPRAARSPGIVAVASSNTLPVSLRPATLRCHDTIVETGRKIRLTLALWTLVTDELHLAFSVRGFRPLALTTTITTALFFVISISFNFAVLMSFLPVLEEVFECFTRDLLLTAS